MKTNYLSVAFVLFFLTSAVNGQNAKLSVCVINDVDKPEAGLVIFADDIEGTTDDKGEFSVNSPDHAGGSPITISIDRPGWSVLKPFMGRTATLNDQTNGECIPVTIAPKRSPRFLDSDSLSSLIGKLQTAGTFTVDLSTNIKSEVKAVRNLEQDKLLKAYERLSGFEVKEIEAAIRERRQGTSTLETLREADRAWREGDHAKAVLLYRKVGTEDMLSAGTKRAELEDYRAKITALMRAGTVSFEDYKFKEALADFQLLEKRYDSGGISKDTFQAEWLDLEYYLGRTKVELSSEAKLDEATALLNNAVDSYRRALRSVSGQEFPDNQAKLQYGLGTALLELGKARFNLPGELLSIKQAGEAFSKAAKSTEQLNRTGSASLSLPSLQISIGEAWYALGMKTGGRESVGYLNKALDAFDNADKALKQGELRRDQDKRNWADLNLNLGRTRLNLADRTSDPTRRVVLVKNAVAAFQEASTTYTTMLDSNQNPCISCAARSLIDLAISWDILRQQSSQSTDRAEYRKKTLVTFDQADKAIHRIKPEEEPFSWAALKGVLGHAFSDLGRKTSDPTEIAEYFERASKAHEEAYTLLSEGYCPRCAVQSLVEVGLVWSMLGQATRDSAKSLVYFGKASDAFDRADTDMNSIKQDGRPLASPGLKATLGHAFAVLAGRASAPAKSEEYVNKAAKAYDESYALANQGHCTPCAVHLLIDLGNAWDALGRIAGNPAKSAEYRKKTLAAFEKADKAINNINREQEPISWAGSKATLGVAFSNLAAGTSDPSMSADYLRKAAAAFEAAAAVYNGPDVAQDYCAPCAVHSLLDLANAWDMLGVRVSSVEKRSEYTNKAADAYDQADKVINRIKRNEDKFIWAGLKTDLGQVFADLANRTSDSSRKADLLNKAAVAYDEVAKVYDGADATEEYCTPCATATLLSLGRAWYTLGQSTGNQGVEYRNKALASFDKARKAINRIKREEEPFTWSRLTANLGDAFSDLASKTTDPAKNAEYLSSAATAYDEEASAYALLLENQEYCSPCVTSALTDLGNAWNVLGERASGANIVEYFRKGADAFEKAGNTIKRDDKHAWADLNLNKGRTLANLASRTSDPTKKAEYLDKAATAYEEVASAYAILFGGQDYCSPCASHSLIELGTAWNMSGQITSDPTKSAEYRDKTLAALEKAGIAINRIKPETDAVTLAGLDGDLGNALSELAFGTSDPTRKAEYLDRAATAFAEAARVYATLLASQDYCPSCLTSALTDLGISWNLLGERSGAQAKGVEYFGNAVEAFAKAENTARREDDKRVWADLHIELGRAFSNLAYQTSDPTKKADYLDKGANAYEEVASAFTILFASQDHCSPCEAHSLIDLGGAWNKLGEASSDPVKNAEYRRKTLATLDQGNKAINGIKREDDPFTWATLNGDLGDAYSVLADEATDSTENAEYLNKSAAAFDEEAKTYAALLADHDYCSSCLTSALGDLGIAWNLLGERADAPEKSVEYFGKAVAVFDKTGDTINHDKDKLLWAYLNVKLGQTFSNLARRTNDQTKRADYDNKAARAYEEARKIYTLQNDPREWADVTVYLAETYSSLEKWDAAFELSNRVLQAFPDDKTAYTVEVGALHDGLFQFEKAFDFKKKWLDRHPDDLIAQSDLAENYFTTAKFVESIQLINKLLTNPDIEVETKTALRVIEIGCLLATDQSRAVSAKLDALIDEVRKQPINFRVRWIFRGTRHFVEEHKKLAGHREWLEQLFDAVENNNHDTLLTGVTDLQAKFKK